MSEISTVRSRISDLRSRISKEASTLSRFERTIHNRLLSDSTQTPEFSTATRERENTLMRTNYGIPWLQETPDNIIDRLDDAVELTSTAFDHVSHLSAAAAEYRGLNLLPLRKDVEAENISVKQLQVLMERRLRTVQEEQANIETKLRQKQGTLAQLRSDVAKNERIIGIKQSEVTTLLAEGDRLRREAEQKRAEMQRRQWYGGLVAAGFLTVICPPAGIAVAVGTTAGVVAGFRAADEKQSAARNRQEEANSLREHTQRLQKQSSDLEKEADSLSSGCSRHRAEISATYSELSSVRTSQSTYNEFQQQIGTFSQRTSELDDRISALQARDVELVDEQSELITGLSDVAKTLESCHASVSDTLASIESGGAVRSFFRLVFSIAEKLELCYKSVSETLLKGFDLVFGIAKTLGSSDRAINA
ncbi:hypothetical protein BDD12DRAFT_874099 [Trichophaea hybrida]|nr:hypothetical protein BDD12DRAFT_874099 [Trichophaea hybrida]